MVDVLLKKLVYLASIEFKRGDVGLTASRLLKHFEELVQNEQTQRLYHVIFGLQQSVVQRNHKQGVFGDVFELDRDLFALEPQNLSEDSQHRTLGHQMLAFVLGIEHVDQAFNPVEGL